MGYLRDVTDFIGFTDSDEGEPSSTTTVVKDESIPQYLEDFSKEQLDLIDKLSKQPYEEPSISGIAGFDDEQIAALDAAKDYYGTEGGTEAYKAGSGALGNLTALADQRITDEGALDPFMNMYLDPARAEIDRAYEISQNKADAAALGPGGYSAFGGDRRGVVDAELLGNVVRQKAGLQKDAFDTAVNNYYKDMTVRGQAAGAAMTGAGSLQNLKGKDLGGQFMFGGYNQAMEQAKINELLQREKDARDNPFKMADFRQGALTGIPYGTSVTQTTDAYTPSDAGFMTGLGNIGSVASGIGNFFTPTASAGGGTTPSAASGWSNLYKKVFG
jgi:hypothetical protein